MGNPGKVGSLAFEMRNNMMPTQAFISSLKPAFFNQKEHHGSARLCARLEAGSADGRYSPGAVHVKDVPHLQKVLAAG